MPSSMNWVDGAAGGTPVSAANLNKLAVTADVGTAGTPTDNALKAAYVSQRGQRRRDLPGISNLLTAYTGTAPTVSLSAANAASPITGALDVGYSNLNISKMSLSGAQLAWAQDDANALTPSSVVPKDGNSFQVYRAGLVTDAPLVAFQVRGVGSTYRVWVDGHPLSLAASTLPTGGALYWMSVNFSGVRAVRNVELEIDTGHLVDIQVTSGDLATSAAKAGVRAVVLGDSYVEGTGADARFTAWPWKFGRLCGWAETVAAGSGGTGYLVDGSPTYTGRQTFRARFDAVVTVHNPDVVVIAGGRNDTASFTASQVGTEVTALLSKAKSALPNAQLVVCSTFPASSGEVTSMQPYSDAISSAASSAGALFLDVMGSNAYIGGTTNLVFSDGVHPNQAGHDALARALFRQYAAALAA